MSKNNSPLNQKKPIAIAPAFAYMDVDTNVNSNVDVDRNVKVNNDVHIDKDVSVDKLVGDNVKVDKTIAVSKDDSVNNNVSVDISVSNDVDKDVHVAKNVYVYEKKPKFDDVYKRQTIYIEREFVKKIEKMSGKERGLKTKIFNDAIREFLNKYE